MTHPPLSARNARRSGLIDAALAQARDLVARGAMADAAALLAALLEAAPDDAETLRCGGSIANLLGRYDLAHAVLGLARARDPRAAVTHVELGFAALKLDLLDEAEEASRHALALEPGRLDARLTLAAVERCRGRMDRAERHCREALAVHPDARGPLLTLGGVLAETGATGDALACFDRILAGDPGDAEARWNRAITCLFAGQLAEGWRDFEARWDSPGFGTARRWSSLPAWNGADPAALGLLVWREQGLGDEILHASMLPDLIERSGSVAIECEPRLRPLFERSFPGARVFAHTDPPDPALARFPVDAQTPSGSLAPHLRTSLASFPSRAGYLAADAVEVAAWKQRLDTLGPELKVGVCWRSHDLSGERGLACADIDTWLPVLRVPGVRFVNLLHSGCDAEIAHAKASGGPRIERFPDLDLRNDLDGTAALMRALDLVISAPTTVSILSGALGTPTWQLVSGIDWHALGGAASPWLPALRRFYRPWNETWAAVLERVAAELARAADAHRVAHAGRSRELGPFAAADPAFADMPA